MFCLYFVQCAPVIAKIPQHKIKMGQAEANNGGEEYSDDVYRILRHDYSYSINMSHKKRRQTREN